MKNLFLVFAVFAFAVLSAAVPAKVRPLLKGKKIQCEGNWSGHLQGFVFDGKDKLYWVFNQHLVQTDLNGKLLNATLLKREEGFKNHGGDPCYADGKIYVPYCGSGFNTELKDKPSLNFVQVYDEKDLSHLQSFPIPEVIYGAGAMAYADGRFFVAGGRPAGMPGNSVYEYSPEFKLLKKHQLEFNSHKGIQTIAFDGKNFWFGCYSIRHGSAFRTGRDFKVNGYYNFSGAYGMVPLDGRKMLLASPAGGKKSGGQAVVADTGKMRKITVRLELDDGGRIFYNNKECLPAELSGKLKNFRRKHIVISVPRRLPAEKVVSAVSAVSQWISADFDIVLQ